MKELTTEQKAQRYDEAIEIAREINNEQRAQPFNVMTRVFPELKESKESEDEKIRKALLLDIPKVFPHDKAFKYIAWLEKQGGQNLAFIEKGKWYVCIRTSYKPNGKDFIEGKTYYAKEDYKIIGECGEVDIATDNPEEFFRSATEEETNDIIKNFVNEQNSAWSEDDEQYFNFLEKLLENLQVESTEDEIKYGTISHSEYYYKIIQWLKSLRPQNRWKPTKEQLETFDYYLDADISNKDKEILFGLYNDLKQL